MKFIETKIKDLFIIEPDLNIDKRGYFARFFCEKEFKKIGLNFKIIQTNLSFTNKKGTIRGMHFQKLPKAEDKIVHCIRGAIYDIVIDLRKNSSTYRQWVSIELNEENKKMLYIPKGFAHGFQCLSDNCEVLYFMSEFYSPEHESGVRWNDSFFDIKWPIENPILSKKDKSWSLIKSK